MAVPDTASEDGFAINAFFYFFPFLSCSGVAAVRQSSSRKTGRQQRANCWVWTCMWCCCCFRWVHWVKKKRRQMTVSFLPGKQKRNRHRNVSTLIMSCQLHTHPRPHIVRQTMVCVPLPIYAFLLPVQVSPHVWIFAAVYVILKYRQPAMQGKKM